MTAVLLAALATAAPPPPPRLELRLVGVEASRLGKQTLIACRVELENRTGRELKVRSNFGSAFDALHVVVRDADGKELARQSVAAHQSPFAPPGRLFPVPPGATAARVGALLDLPADARNLRVMVYGALPESGFDDLLLTDVRPVTVREKAE